MDKKVFFGRNLAYLADFWLWAFYMRNPALCLSFSLFLSFSMSISLFSLFLHVYISLHIYLSSPLKKNTSNVLTNAGIVFGGSASSPARVASWYYHAPDGPAPREFLFRAIWVLKSPNWTKNKHKGESTRRSRPSGIRTAIWSRRVAVSVVAV